MFKKILATATLVCALPALANAYTLTTWAKSQGGKIDSKVMQNQRVINGAKAVTFTNNSTCYITPDTGWKISKIERNGLVQTLPAPGSAYSTRFTAPLASNISLFATFARQSIAISATAGGNGYIIGSSSYSPVYYGTQSPTRTIVFKPLPGFAATVTVPAALTVNVDYQLVDATTNAVIAGNTGAVNQSVKVVIANVPVGTSSLAVSATFAGTPATPPVAPTAATIVGLARNGCANCHNAQGVGNGVFAAWSSSGHKTAQVICYSCHVGANSGAHPGSPQACTVCHSSVARHSVAANTCSECHDVHSAAITHPTAASRPDCVTCHQTNVTNFATSLHGTRPGKETFYNDRIGDPAAPALQKGFGNYVDVAYSTLPCADCHNAAATTVNGVDTWPGPTCADCHNNNNLTQPVAAATCFGCHSRQAYESMAFGLTDVHFTAGMGCSSCHSTTDMHGDGTAKASLLAPGAITANCRNCHGEGKSRGPISSIAEHLQHANDIDCSTCHIQSVVACYNCHFDNEGINNGSVTHQKFASAKFGGQGDKSWRFLVNRVMPDGSTKIFPGSMQSLMADQTAKGDGQNDGQGVTFVAIASYYSHAITRSGALTCDKCHGTETATRLANGVPVDVVKWKPAAGEVVQYGPTLGAAWQGPKGVIPVPENTSLLNFDFVDLTNPAGAWDAANMNVMSPRVLFKRGADAVHMPEAYVKPLTSSQMQKLANPYRAAATTSATAHAAGFIGTNQYAEHTTCAGCHVGVFNMFSTSQHGTRQGKLTWYADNIGNPGAVELQKGFGNYVNVAYADLPCGKCHNAAAWTPSGGSDQWTASTGGVSVCTDCHGNKVAGVDTTSVYAPVTAATCKGCHSRQANETAAGLTDVHLAAGMTCTGCHSFTDMHGTGTQTASQLQWGTISAQCENCHGAGKSQGPISSIAAHLQHAGDIACSTCHAESMITCHNCHFDNEAGAGGAAKAKFFSGRFGGTAASGNSWRFLVNRVMPDGTTKIYPGSMQSLVADYTVDNANDGQGHTHAGIAPYYSHAITRVNALTCDKCHGTETAVKLAAGQSVRVTTWNAAAGVAVPAASVAATFVGPKGVIPVPENPRGKLLMDFVDLTNPEQGNSSARVLFQKDGPDTIHMPEAYVKPLTAAQMQKLANPQFDHTSAVATAGASPAGFTANTCQGCHQAVNTVFASSLHATRQGKATFYNATSSTTPLEVGFGTYVTVGYSALPCADCHNPAAWTPTGGSDTWPSATGGNPVCTDCHTNKVAGAATTSFDAPVTKATCIGCHSRQANESSMGLTDVHTSGAVINGQTMNFSCSGCHPFSDLHGTGQQLASQLAPGAVTANCETCHTAMAASTTPEHTQHMANIACSTCHMESVITCYGCHFDNEASDPADSTILHAKFASGKFGGTIASGKSWRFLVNRVMPDGSTKVYPASMQSLVADRTAANAPGEDNAGWTHAAIAPYYSHSITRVNALKCDKCHGIQKAIDLNNGTPVRVVKWNAAAGVQVPVGSMMATYTAPSGVIPVPENPVGKLLMDFVDLVNPAAGPLNASGTSPSNRVLFKADGPDTIHMPGAYVRPLTAAQINSLATPQARP